MLSAQLCGGAAGGAVHAGGAQRKARCEVTDGAHRPESTPPRGACRERGVRCQQGVLKCVVKAGRKLPRASDRPVMPLTASSAYSSRTTESTSFEGAIQGF